MFSTHGWPIELTVAHRRSSSFDATFGALHAVEIIARRGGCFGRGCKQGCVRTDANEREPLLEAGGGMAGVAGRMSAMPASPVGSTTRAAAERNVVWCCQNHDPGTSCPGMRGQKHMSADDRELRNVVDAAWVLGAVTRCLLTEDPGIGGGAAIDAAAQDVMNAVGVRISPGRERVILGRACAPSSAPDSHGRGARVIITGRTSRIE